MKTDSSNRQQLFVKQQLRGDYLLSPLPLFAHLTTTRVVEALPTETI